jgi:transposase
VAREIHVNETTLGSWVAKYRDEHAGEKPPLSITDRVRFGNWSGITGNSGEK